MLNVPPTVPKKNPYVAGKAIGSNDGFFGREDILNVVRDALSSHQSAIVLAGQRRIGKTSILLQLQRRLPADRFCPVYFDLMDRAGETLEQVLGALASTVAAETGVRPEAFQIGQEGAGFQSEFLPQLYAALWPERRLVILLDEFDVLDSASPRNLQPNSASVKFFPFLRRLMEQDERPGFVFVVGRKVDELSIQFKAAFKAALFKRVSVLETEAARSLVLAAERGGTLRFDPAAVEQILALTSGHPLFTQLICQIAWDSAHIDSPELVPEVTMTRVNEVVERALEAGENVFQWIWDGLPPAERVISAAIARATMEHKVVSEDDLLITLQGHGIRILTRELNLAPETLVDWEVLRRVEGGYEFFIELMRLWVQNRKPLLKVKSELDRIVHPANELFRSADIIYRQGDRTGVEPLLQQVLRINPNHVNARLLLGEYFLEEERAAEAVAILEEAFQYDEDNARYPLVRALLLHGGGQEESGLEAEAVTSYDRVLRLSPKERNARDRLNQILVRQGERLLAAGDMEGARAAFSQAGATDRLELLEAVRRKQRTGELSQRLDDLTAKEQYGEALDVANALVHEEPDNPEWRSRAEKAARENALQSSYAEGVGALATRDFARAIRALGEVIHMRPEYRDAARSLAEAVEGARIAAKKAEEPDVPPALPTTSALPVEKSGRSWLRRIAFGFAIALAAFVAFVRYTVSHLVAPANSSSSGSPEWYDKVGASEQTTEVSAGDGIEIVHSAAGKAVLAAFVPNSDFLLTGGDDGFVRLWDINKKTQLFEQDHKGAVQGLVVGPGGTFFATLATDNTIRIFPIVRPRQGFQIGEGRLDIYGEIWFRSRAR